MKAWRLQPCPRGADGKKVKGANRRAVRADSSLTLRGYAGMSHTLQRLFSLGEIERTAEKHLARLLAERKARVERRAHG